VRQWRCRSHRRQGSWTASSEPNLRTSRTGTARSASNQPTVRNCQSTGPCNSGRPRTLVPRWEPGSKLALVFFLDSCNLCASGNGSCVTCAQAPAEPCRSILCNLCASGNVELVAPLRSILPLPFHHRRRETEKSHRRRKQDVLATRGLAAVTPGARLWRLCG